MPTTYTLRRPRPLQLPSRSMNSPQCQALSHAVTRGVTTASGAQPRTSQRAGVLLTRRTRVAHLAERLGRTPTRQRDDTAHFTHRALTRRLHSRRTAQHCTQRACRHASHARSGHRATSRTARASTARAKLFYINDLTATDVARSLA